MPGPDETRCPLNAPGDFYTRGHCLACGLPEDDAPELLAPLNEHNDITHFVRQPQTPEEIARACNALRVCCVQDLRYGGQDREIIHLLGNDPAYCDYVVSATGELIRAERPLGEHLVPLHDAAFFHLDPWSKAKYNEPFTVAAIYTVILLVPVVVSSTVIVRARSQVSTMLIVGGLLMLASLTHAYLGAALGARKSSIVMLVAVSASLLTLFAWWRLS